MHILCRGQRGSLRRDATDHGLESSQIKNTNQHHAEEQGVRLKHLLFLLRPLVSPSHIQTLLILLKLCNVLGTCQTTPLVYRTDSNWHGSKTYSSASRRPAGKVISCAEVRTLLEEDLLNSCSYRKSLWHHNRSGSRAVCQLVRVALSSSNL